MAKVSRFPQPAVATLAEGYTLPANATPVILTNTVTIDSTKAGNIWVRVYAVNAVELVNPNTLIFHPVTGTSTTAVATWAGGGTIHPGTVISAITASANSTISWAAGALICEFVLPKSQIPSTHRYLAVYAVTVADEHADEIEAYVFVE